MGEMDFCCSKSRQKLISHLELWINDMGDDLSVALAQYSMYPLIFLAVLLHDHQSCYYGTPDAIYSQPYPFWSEWICPL